MKYHILLIIIILLIIPQFPTAGNFDSSKKISLAFEDVPIATVLNMIAQQYDLNLVLSGGIDGNITVKLDNVDLGDAMNAILASNGYNYYMAGDIVVVKPLATNAVGETTARIIDLNYVSPAAVVNAVTDLLSSKGKIKVVESTGSAKRGENIPLPSKVVIVDLPHIVESIVEFIGRIDKREPQVQIQVRLIETNIDATQKVGFNWPTSLTARMHGITNTTGTGTTTSSSESMAAYDLPDGPWKWGKLSIGELSLMLEFLESRGNSKLISDPKITTSNHSLAEIKVTTIVPIQTINRFSEGAAVQDIVTFQNEEIGITLQVTPHITDDNRIVLDVFPSVAEIIGYAGTEGYQVPITSERSVRTRVTVRDQETVVLGGLIKEQQIETESRVFFLGSIPILGHLFRHKSTETKTTDLTILITPTILRD